MVVWHRDDIFLKYYLVSHFTQPLHNNKVKSSVLSFFVSHGPPWEPMRCSINLLPVCILTLERGNEYRSARQYHTVHLWHVSPRCSLHSVFTSGMDEQVKPIETCYSTIRIR